jgi:trehalose 6-phosphate synthase/phosphatase
MVDQTAKYMDAGEMASIAFSFRKAESKLILLDYDGTLVPFQCEPAEALPDENLMKLLHRMSEVANLDLVIISGRSQEFLEKIFGDLKASLFAEHGAIYRIDGTWKHLENEISRKEEVSQIMQKFVNLTPGSFLEVKQNSLVWHYRKTESGLAETRSADLVNKLTPVCDNNNLTIMKGRKIVEIKPSDYTKGTAIISLFDCLSYDFILAAGDDVTDEDLFVALPKQAVKIHIGKFADISDFTIRNSPEFVSFLQLLMSR